MDYPQVTFALAPMIIMVGAGLWPTRKNIGATRTRRHHAHNAAWLSFAVSLIAALLVARYGSMSWTLSKHPALHFGVYLDTLTAIMLVLVSFLGALVIRYSITCMSGNERQVSFMRWLCLTIGSVLGLLVAGNLLMFTVAWMATSMSLHQLLTFNSERPGAVLAAKKKFIVSRLGDMCLLAAIVLCWRIFHTWDFASIFRSAAVMAANGNRPKGIGWLDALLVLAACLKSAQFPFHSWLPETMETPTPVSALMHAGIINAGGFLVIRLSSLLILCPQAMAALALAGAVTALYGSTVMMAQTSIKRSLAFSTVGQMGFMMLECGLGAFGLAVLHLVAHSLYKAHAFLSSGGTVNRSPHLQAAHDYARPYLAATPASFLLVVLPLLATNWLMMREGIPMAQMPLLVVPMIALTYLFWRIYRPSVSPIMPVIGLLSVLALYAAYTMLGWGTNALLAATLPSRGLSGMEAEPLLVSLLTLMYVTVAWFQIYLYRPPQSNKSRAFYVHVANGFYVGTLANRIVTFLWPISPAKKKMTQQPSIFKESLDAPEQI